jgi:hypothetical protein
LRVVRELFDSPSWILTAPSERRRTARHTSFFIAFIAGELADPERFLKSRVYAKLLKAADFEMLSDF